MKIDVLFRDRLENGNIIVHALVVGEHSIAKAVKAIELTNEADDESLKQRLHILDERDQLRERVDKLKSSLAHAHREVGDLGAENKELKGALDRCGANYREMMKQRDRIEAENNELRDQLTNLGNVITEALGNTDYVPF